MFSVDQVASSELLVASSVTVNQHSYSEMLALEVNRGRFRKLQSEELECRIGIPLPTSTQVARFLTILRDKPAFPGRGDELTCLKTFSKFKEVSKAGRRLVIPRGY